MGPNGQPDRAPRLLVIIASIRDGRAGLPVGQWFEQVAREHGGFDVAVADLKEIDLPLMTEPNHPRLKQYTQPATWAWSERVDAADAFVLVMPEYNFTATAPLVNALDYLVQEWAYKPVGLVTYGGISGGLRAAQHLKPKLTALNMHPIKETVTVQFVANHVQEGAFTPNDSHPRSAVEMLDALLRWEAALRQLRQPATVAAD
jgi:NAD(P)H-dependent FMN reductase